MFQGAAGTPAADMYSFYQMLNGIKKELVSGPQRRGDTDSELLEAKTKKEMKKPRRKVLAKRKSVQQSDSESSIGYDSAMSIESSDSEVLTLVSTSDESDAEENCEMTGNPETQSDWEENEEDKLSRQTAAVFRHHLKGLFGILQNLTHTAHNLTAKYQQDLGDCSSSSQNVSKLPSFTL